MNIGDILLIKGFTSRSELPFEIEVVIRYRGTVKKSSLYSVQSLVNDKTFRLTTGDIGITGTDGDFFSRDFELFNETTNIRIL